MQPCILPLTLVQAAVIGKLEEFSLGQCLFVLKQFAYSKRIKISWESDSHRQYQFSFLTSIPSLNPSNTPALYSTVSTAAEELNTYSW